MLWSDCFEWLFLFSWNDQFFWEKDDSLNFRRVLWVIFTPSEIKAKMTYHVIALQLLFYFRSVSPLPPTFWWHGSWVGWGGGGQGGHNLPPPIPFCPFVSPLPSLSETDETLTQSTHVCMCYAISFMTYDVSDLERFSISPEVMPFFFRSTKFCLKSRRTLNWGCWVHFFEGDKQ